HAHMVFDDGCTVNLTASRISAKAERRMRLFQQDRYFSIDFAVPAAREYVAVPGAATEGRVREEVLDVRKGDELHAEIEAFLAAVLAGEAPPISG
ncbi:MAG: gfo/Idh/MocA family oxidoreductase, partial [Gammaproteobacteria bacterium]|nr:gfo/Idh/MocA family oxidoreductase [Gammaproteobacteria bacterium]NIT63449.1 gfo/Idh/MocA family oxidoreductase [Gammaproteobacteria bacterium]NIV20381.1 gfo/Idh/MocA family oxidoreductase [Gammaproteobacteria bacterium]NIY32029.1 gfo/Idh/MocA family oxidoreductase [Gammaproteobacteria bacterium]